ncbi:TPA: MFS transporter, partial [Pseudomonas aeruginosa]|nr:MFS transporter [Pseudomonas aeruginosa]
LAGVGVRQARLATQAVTAHRLPGSLAGLDAELPAALLWRLRVSAGPTADTVGASGRTAGVQLQADRR